MFKKTVLALVTAATFGLSAVAISTPAEAGFWYHGAFVDREVGWEHYRCHMEWRRVAVWHHGIRFWERARVRVCD
jgi:hypothetical protein